MAKFMNLIASRSFSHRKYGQIGTATLAFDNGEWKLDGTILPKNSIEYLLNFSLQSLQDAYAGSENLTDAIAAFSEKKSRVQNGTIGIRGESADEATAVSRGIVRKVLKAGGKSVPENDAEIDAIFAKNREKLQHLVDEEIAERARKRAEKVALSAIDVEM